MLVVAAGAVTRWGPHLQNPQQKQKWPLHIEIGCFVSTWSGVRLGFDDALHTKLDVVGRCKHHLFHGWKGWPR